MGGSHSLYIVKQTFFVYTELNIFFIRSALLSCEHINESYETDLVLTPSSIPLWL